MRLSHDPAITATKTRIPMDAPDARLGSMKETFATSGRVLQIEFRSHGLRDSIIVDFGFTGCR